MEYVCVRRVLGRAAVVLSLVVPGTRAFAGDETTRATTDAGTSQLGEAPPFGGYIRLYLQGSLESRDSYWRNYNVAVLGEFANAALGGPPPPSSNVAGLGTQASGGSRIPRTWAPSVTVDFTYLHTYFGTSTVGFAGGLRFTNLSNDKYRFFGGLRAGIEHDEFNNAFAIYPGGGVIFPIAGQPFSVVAGIDYAVVFYSGFTSKGPSFYGGIGFPLRPR